MHNLNFLLSLEEPSPFLARETEKRRQALAKFSPNAYRRFGFSARRAPFVD